MSRGGRLMAGCSAIGIAAGLGVAPPALAGEEEATVVDSVIITAQFRDQALQDVPISVTAVSADLLEARSQTNIAEVANQAPNVTLRPAGGAFGPALASYIRGVGQGDFNYALEPGVGMYVDDVYYSTLTGSLFDLLDLERVEILRGPQGTLAGQNSIGGAVKLYSRRPGADGRGFVEATYGSDNRVEFRGGSDFTLIENQLYGRISGVSVNQDGYVTRYDFGCTHPGSGAPAQTSNNGCVLGTEGGKSYTGIRAALTWFANDRFDVDFSADYTNDDSEASPTTLLYVGNTTAEGGGVGAANTFYGTVPIGTATGSAFIAYSPFSPSSADDTFSNSPYITYSTYNDIAPNDGNAPYSVPAVSQVDTWGGSINANFRFSDSLSLKSITGWREYEGQWSIDEGTPAGTYMLHNLVSHEQFTQELRLNGLALNDTLNYTLGAFYLDQESFYGGRIKVRTLPAFTENDVIPASSQAVFAHADWALTPQTNIVAGIRYTEMEKDFIYGRLGIGGNPAPPQVAGLDGLVGHFEGSSTDYRLGVQHRWNDEIMTYAQFSTGFRGGGINPRPFFATQAQPHDPETLDAYEIGVKTNLFDNSVRFNASAFYNEYHDILVTVASCPDFTPTPSGSPCALPTNAGEATVKGFEAELFARPMPRLQIDASLGILDFEYDSISAAGASSGITLASKARGVPDLQYSIGVQYEFDALGGSLTPRLDFSHEDELFSDVVNVRPFGLVPAKDLLNGRVTWANAEDDLQIALQVTNITDEIYYYNIRDDRGSSLTVQGNPAPPRQWALSIKRKY
jgi:iron complex outermembrane receptor protein